MNFCSFRFLVVILPRITVGYDEIFKYLDSEIEWDQLRIEYP